MKKPEWKLCQYPLLGIITMYPGHFQTLLDLIQVRISKPPQTASINPLDSRPDITLRDSTPRTFVGVRERGRNLFSKKPAALRLHCVSFSSRLKFGLG